MASYPQFYLVDGSGNEFPLHFLTISEPPPRRQINPERVSGDHRFFYSGDGERVPHLLKLTGPMGTEVAQNERFGGANHHAEQLRQLGLKIASAQQIEYEVEGVRYYLELDLEAPKRGEYRRVKAEKLGRYSGLELTLCIKTRNWKRKSDGLEFGPIV